MERACFGERARRAEGCRRGVPDLRRGEAVCVLPSSPPTTRTRPSGRSVAVWSERASASGPAGLKDAVAGSQTSAVASASSPPMPPMTRTRPSGRRVARVQVAGLGERACRAEGCRGRVPDLGRGEAESSASTSRRRRGPVRRAGAVAVCDQRVLGERACRAERAVSPGPRPPPRRGPRRLRSYHRPRGRGRRAGAWRCASTGLGERACRAEGRRGRVPDLRRGERPSSPDPAADHEDAAVGQERRGVDRRVPR